MSRKGDAEDSTFRTVRERADRYERSHPPEPSPSAMGFPTVSDSAVRLFGTAVGVGIGLLLLALAATAFYAAYTWSEAITGRDGAVVAYSVTGFFLTLAGLGAIIGTLNHNYRVAVSEPEHH